MSVVDGFAAAVPAANKEAYRAHVEIVARVFKEYGALEVVECWGVDVPEGKVTSFPMAVQCTPDEVVVFSWIRWASKEDRDRGMAATMADPRVSPEQNPMPFDGKRVIFGTFNVLVQA